MLNAQDAIPLYEKLRDLLREQIEQGRYRPGEPIPSERELCRAHRISRITVRQAIAGMIHDGLLVRKQGKGTFVARRKVSQGLSRIVTFRRTVLDIGMKPSTRILSHGLLPADLEVASVLKLPEAGQVLKNSSCWSWGRPAPGRLRVVLPAGDRPQDDGRSQSP